MLPQTFETAPAQRAELSSGPLFYRQAGQGAPLLLLHGWGGSSRHWYLTMQELATIRTVYALDMPGYGKTPPLHGPSSAERQAACVLEFADKMGLERFDINGHSFGGAVAAYLAAHHPERINRLILTSFGTLDTTMGQFILSSIYLQTSLPMQFWHYWMGMFQPWFMLWQSSLVAASYNPVVLFTISRPFFYHIPFDPLLIQEGFNEFVLMDARTAVENPMSLGNPELSTALTQIAAPTLLIAGHQDMLMLPALIEQAAQIIPGSQIHWIEACGHVPMIERPADYTRALQDFLTNPQGIKTNTRPAA